MDVMLDEDTLRTIIRIVLEHERNWGRAITPLELRAALLRPS